MSGLTHAHVITCVKLVHSATSSSRPTSRVQNANESSKHALQCCHTKLRGVFGPAYLFAFESTSGLQSYLGADALQVPASRDVGKPAGTAECRTLASAT